MSQPAWANEPGRDLAGLGSNLFSLVSLFLFKDASSTFECPWMDSAFGFDVLDMKIVSRGRTDVSAIKQ